MKHLLIMFAALCLASCASTRHTSKAVQQQIDYTYTQRQDSIFRALLQRDSVYVRDSVYIYVKGDTVTKYVEKTLYKWRTCTDTVYRDRWRADTLYIERTDSVTVEKPVYIEKPIAWYNQGLIWLGRVAILVLLFFVLRARLKSIL